MNTKDMNQLLKYYREDLKGHYFKNEADKVEVIPEQQKLIIVSLMEDNDILTSLWKFFGERDVDVMEYTMHSKMICDKDNNFITTITLTFIDIQG
jgi:hypothetical protein